MPLPKNSRKGEGVGGACLLKDLLHLRTVRVLPARRRRVMHWVGFPRGRAEVCPDANCYVSIFTHFFYHTEKKEIEAFLNSFYLFAHLLILLRNQDILSGLFECLSEYTEYLQERRNSFLFIKMQKLARTETVDISLFPYVIFELLSLNLSHGPNIRASVTLVFEPLWSMCCARR